MMIEAAKTVNEPAKMVNEPAKMMIEAAKMVNEPAKNGDLKLMKKRTIKWCFWIELYFCSYTGDIYHGVFG